MRAKKNSVERARLLFEGAEGKLWSAAFEGMAAVKKERVAKKYRHPLLDRSIRLNRFQAEIRQLNRARQAGVRVPRVLQSDEKDFSITLEKIGGSRLADALAKKPARPFARELAAMVATLHASRIVHGDLTTGNVLVAKKKLVLVDFGLSFVSHRIEDFATDLLNLKKTLLAVDPSMGRAWKRFVKAYARAWEGGPRVVRAVEKGEGRGRYKAQKSAKTGVL